MSTEIRIFSERELRAMPTCVGCGRDKDRGLVCCWTCFKYKKPELGVEPLKYSGVSIDEWQRQLATARAAGHKMAKERKQAIERWDAEYPPGDGGLFGEY